MMILRPLSVNRSNILPPLGYEPVTFSEPREPIENVGPIVSSSLFYVKTSSARVTSKSAWPAPCTHLSGGLRGERSLTTKETCRYNPSPPRCGVSLLSTGPGLHEDDWHSDQAQVSRR